MSCHPSGGLSTNNVIFHGRGPRCRQILARLDSEIRAELSQKTETQYGNEKLTETSSSSNEQAQSRADAAVQTSAPRPTADKYVHTDVPAAPCSPRQKSRRKPSRALSGLWMQRRQRAGGSGLHQLRCWKACRTPLRFPSTMSQRISSPTHSTTSRSLAAKMVCAWYAGRRTN